MVKRKLAFTLSEVLITVGIIGVVAAITIPTLMTNFRAKQYKIKLKKAISTLSQAERSAEAHYDIKLAENFGSCDNINTPNPSTCALLLATLNGAGKVNKFSINKAEFSNSATGNNYIFNVLEENTGIRIQLPDGVLISLGDGGWVSSYNPYTLVIIDVNGVTPPNKITSCSTGKLGPTTKTRALGFYNWLTAPSCMVKNKDISDIYTVLLTKEGEVIPADNATEYVLNH